LTTHTAVRQTQDFDTATLPEGHGDLDHPRELHVGEGL